MSGRMPPLTVSPRPTEQVRPKKPTAQGVPQDYVLAHMWFNLAAVQNHIDAIKNRDLVSAKMTPAQIADAWRQAREWKPKPER